MDITFWHWLILGCALISFEMLVPGTFLLWPGVAALVTGVMSYGVAAMPWQGAAGIFLVLTVVASVVGHRLYRRLYAPAHDRNKIWQRARAAQALVGSIHVLAHPLANGRGVLHVGETIWTIRGPEIAGGGVIRVVGVDGAALVVEKVGV